MHGGGMVAMFFSNNIQNFRETVTQLSWQHCKNALFIQTFLTALPFHVINSWVFLAKNHGKRTNYLHFTIALRLNNPQHYLG